MSVTHIRSLLNFPEDNANNNNVEAAYLIEEEVEMNMDPEDMNEDDNEEGVVDENVLNNENESNLSENNGEVNGLNNDGEVIDPPNDVMETDLEVINEDGNEEVVVEENVLNNENESNLLENNGEADGLDNDGEVIEIPNENKVESENALIITDNSMRENSDRSGEEKDNGNEVESIESVEENKE